MDTISPAATARCLPLEKSRFWSKSAPQPVVEAYRQGDDAVAWSLWLKHLGSRSTPKPIAQLLPGRSSPLGWAIADDVDAAAVTRLCERLESLDRRPRVRQNGQGQNGQGQNGRVQNGFDELLRPWLAEADGAKPNGEHALQCLIWGWALPQLAVHLDSGLWWELLETLIKISNESAALRLDCDVLAHQLFAGELPLTLAYLFPEIKPCAVLYGGARRALSRGPLDLLNGEGLPSGTDLPLLRPLLACWTRSAAIGKRLDKGCWNKAALCQYQWLVSGAIALTRRDGTQVFSAGTSGSWQPDLFEAAMKLGGDDEDRSIADLILPRRVASKRPDSKHSGSQRSGSQKGAATRPATKKLEAREPSYQCEWAGLAYMRPHWARGGVRLTTVYHDHRVDLELDCGRDVVLQGAWDLVVQSDGQAQSPTGTWEQVCWTSDRDVDYLELEIPLTGGFRVQRQILLAREDGFLFLADAVLGTKASQLDYCARIRLGEAVTFEPAAETREARISGVRPRANILPLALPEWRSDRRVGQLSVCEGSLQLEQSISGTSLLAPMFFDLDRRRMDKPLTWRGLTVAEDREIQTSDRAVGFRVQLAKRQWLIYRSLTSPRNRSLLGQNLSSELMVGRFDRSGEVTELLEIE